MSQKTDSAVMVKANKLTLLCEMFSANCAEDVRLAILLPGKNVAYYTVSLFEMLQSERVIVCYDGFCRFIVLEPHIKFTKTTVS
jgi:hypothetical protein